MTAPLVRTKFYRPPVPENLIPHPRLIERLNEAGTRPLTLISAPAGFGKSTLLSAWLQQWSQPIAWLSLDKSDNDLRHFLGYVLAAIRRVVPEMGAATQALLDGLVLPPTAVLVANLINDLDAISQDFVLVLDDYYLISNRDIHNLMAALLHHPPRLMHLVIATRHDPLLPRASLLAQGKWAEGEAYLNRVQPFVEATHNSRFLVETLAQRPWLCLGQGKQDTAVATLKQAITLAAPAHLVRPLADYAAPLRPLWEQLTRQWFMPDYLARIQVVPGFPAAPAHAGATLPTNGHSPGASPGNLPLIEPLTNREMDVLTLMEKRLTNKEIAQELCISVVTVKRHIYNLYQKLGVHGRRQAVNEARRLGVIA
ncbi:MAG: hypothetical protein BroJett015_01040 [Chloroflexota bacterium]|nr:hypothetical protein [Chloroflexota bacterium]GIK54441.1 MAG: hypothetical protein BroJett015_01040 [Chloroflexota bacterium]